MAQSGGTSQKKTWQVWVLALGAVVFGLLAVVSLVVGDYWNSLFLACGAAVMGLNATGVTERGGAWSALVVVVFGVGILALVADIAL